MKSFDDSQLSQIRQQSQSQYQPSSKDCLAQVFQFEHLLQYLYFTSKKVRPKLRLISQSVRRQYAYPLQYSLTTKNSLQQRGSIFTRVLQKTQKQFQNQQKKRKYLTTEELKQLIKSKNIARKESPSKNYAESVSISESKSPQRKYLSTLQIKVKQRIQSLKIFERTEQLNSVKQISELDDYFKKIEEATLERDRIKEELYTSESYQQSEKQIKQLKTNHQQRKYLLQKILQILAFKGALPWLSEFAQYDANKSGVSKEELYSKFEKQFYSIYLDQRQIFLMQAESQDQK